MKSVLISFALIALPVLAVAAAATGPADELTLEDVIFDAERFKKLLGPKTLLVPAEKSGDIPLPLAEGIASAGFNRTTKLLVFPEAGTRPKLKSSIPFSYPNSLRKEGKDSYADFLLSIAADGTVRGLYCYRNDDRMFALAAGAAVVRWRYEPAKINGSLLPVVLQVTLQLKHDGMNEEFHRMRRTHAPVINEVYRPPEK